MARFWSISTISPAFVSVVNGPSGPYTAILNAVALDPTQLFCPGPPKFRILWLKTLFWNPVAPDRHGSPQSRSTAALLLNIPVHNDCIAPIEGLTSVALDCHCIYSGCPPGPLSQNQMQSLSTVPRGSGWLSPSHIISKSTFPTVEELKGLNGAILVYSHRITALGFSYASGSPAPYTTIPLGPDCPSNASQLTLLASYSPGAPPAFTPNDRSTTTISLKYGRPQLRPLDSVALDDLCSTLDYSPQIQWLTARSISSMVGLDSGILLRSGSAVTSTQDSLF
ncbi:hypothetical protein C8J56DRAFT_893611 [Mycena floridula]|nr:hypothetical protein C8J56DRAFT_893611 [Mycena floridula]